MEPDEMESGEKYGANGKTYICKTLASRKDLKTYMGIHTKKQSHKCEICDKVFYSVSKLSSHSEKHVNKKCLKCEKCHKTFKYAVNLESHIKHRRCIDSTMRDISEICNKDFMDEKSHRILRPREELHRCEVCNEVFRTAIVLKDHAQSHTNERPFKCKICCKTFKSKRNLLVHNRTHKLAKEQQWICKICNKALHTSWDLEGHMKSHAEDGNQRCEICDKVFHDVTDYNLHMQTHKSEHMSVLPKKLGGLLLSTKHSLQSETSDKNFTGLSGAQDQVENHESDREKAVISCDICKRIFKQQSHLKSHNKWVHHTY